MRISFEVQRTLQHNVRLDVADVARILGVPETEAIAMVEAGDLDLNRLLDAPEFWHEIDEAATLEDDAVIRDAEVHTRCQADGVSLVVDGNCLTHGADCADFRLHLQQKERTA